VGEVLAALEKRGRKALVLFSSDNGPVLDDGYKDQAVELLGSHQPAGALRGGKGGIYEGGTRVPFLVWWPGRVKPGVSDALVSQVDLLASFAALTGQELGPEDAPDSVNVLPALLGDQAAGREFLVEHSGVLALRQGQWKYIEPSKGPAVAQTQVETGYHPTGHLFHLGGDLGERESLVAKNPEKMRDMAEKLDQIRKNPRSRP
jgi:arylsulfatase A-like enzyme